METHTLYIAFKKRSFLRGCFAVARVNATTQEDAMWKVYLLANDCIGDNFWSVILTPIEFREESFPGGKVGKTLKHCAKAVDSTPESCGKDGGKPPLQVVDTQAVLENAKNTHTLSPGCIVPIHPSAIYTAAKKKEKKEKSPYSQP